MENKSFSLMGAVNILLLFIVIFLIIATYSNFKNTSAGANDSQSPSPKAVYSQKPSSPTGPFPPTSITPNTEMQAKQETGWRSTIEISIIRALGSSNRNKARVYKVEETGKNIKIIFRINDNITEGWIKDGAKADITKILKAVQISRDAYSEIVIFGTFEFTDKFGNSKEETVLKASYTPAIINRINWENFLNDNVYEIAESSWLHPAFR